MIKKGYHSLKQRLKALSLYWKTWIVTSITLIITLVLFFVVFSLFATTFLNKAQQTKFERAVNQITNQVQKNGVDEKYLNEFMVEGYSVFVSNQEGLLYPTYLIETFPAMVSPAIEDYGLPIIENNDNENGIVYFSRTGDESTSLSSKKVVFFQNDLLEVEVFYPVLVTSGEIKEVLLTILPFFIGIGIVVAFVVSRFYGRYVTDKISHLNSLVYQMSTSSISSDYSPRTGDELQELTNNVYHMYQELQSTLNQLNHEIETVTRLEADRQVFMRGATHELKTPIMAMMTTLSGLMEGIEGYEDSEYHLAQCYNRLQSMSRLVNEMLEVSRLEGVVFAGETNLSTTTSEMLQVYDYMILDKGLQLEVKQVPNLKVKIPERTLQKVISNLIGNGVKYSPDKGRLRITSTVNSWEIRNQMSPASQLRQEDIFEPFVSYENESEVGAEKSHGLGLYIVAAILKQYDYRYTWQIDESTKEFCFKIELEENQPFRLEKS